MKVSLRSTAVLFAICLLVPAFAAAQYPPDGPLELQQVGVPQTPEGGSDCATNADNPFANCGFETGDTTGWVVNDVASPLFPVSVVPGGYYLGYGFFTTAPTQGTQSLVHGFDSFGGTVIEVAQDVTVPTGDIVTLEFDYRGAWDLATFGATLDREFLVEVQPSGGGAPMQTDSILTATAGTATPDTGTMSAMVDLSAHSGQAVRVSWQWTIPEAGVGPAFFEFDNVDMTAEITTQLVDVPTQSSVGLAILIAALLGAAVFTMRRRG